jgi:hypothetical protein
MGLLAPELVVYCAWVQWRDARKLTRRMKKRGFSKVHMDYYTQLLCWNGRTSYRQQQIPL